MVTLLAVLAACGTNQAGAAAPPTTAVAGPPAGPSGGPSGGPGTGPSGVGPTAEAPTADNRVAAGRAPGQPFAVGTRQLNLSRGADRPLRTVVWYPATGTAGGTVRANVAVAGGRFPLIVFSHGLTSSPEAMAPVATRLAAAGFVVAAPAYPYTSHEAPTFDPADLIDQPADASTVITEVLRLDARAGDPLAGHLDPTRIGAGGHSAGGFTTAGLLSGSARDRRVRAGVIIAGGSMGGQFAGPATPVLFVHGDADPVVSYQVGRAAYDMLTWPKAFVTIIGGDHGSGLVNAAALRTMVDFFRWSLYGDAAAGARLPSDATVAGRSRYEDRIR